MFSDPLKITVNLEEGTVCLSVRATDNKVEVFEFSIAVFQQMLAQFNAAMEDEDE